MSHVLEDTTQSAHFESDLELKSNTLQPRPDVPIPQHPLKKKAIQALLAAGSLTMIVIWANVLWLFGSLYNAHSYVHRLEVSGIAPSTVLLRLASATDDMLNFCSSHIIHIYIYRSWWLTLTGV
jgi:hypothetical protein